MSSPGAVKEIDCLYGIGSDLICLSNPALPGIIIEWIPYFTSTDSESPTLIVFVPISDAISIIALV